MNDIAFRMALADAFINRVDVFDGEDRRLEIYCNAIKQQIICPISELSRSLMGQLVRQIEPNTNVEILSNGFVIIVPLNRQKTRVAIDFISQLYY